MPNRISPQNFTNNIFAVFEETFEKHHGVYLDKGTSLFETLDTISAEEASLPVSAHCASLAAQVTHVIFYMEVLEKTMRHEEIGKVDWGDIWKRVEAVTTDEWAALKQQLKQIYQRISTHVHAIDNWDDDDTIGGIIAIVVHTAYHLGEIRQALCTLK
jgi:hypothetical protein